MSPIAPFLAPERDEAFKMGRSKASGGTVYYSVPGCVFTTGTSDTPDNGRDYYAPFFVEAPTVVDQLAFHVSTAAAGKNARVGIYRADRNLQPVGGPLTDSGSISIATTGVKTYTPGTPILLQRGRYLSVINHDDNTLVVLLTYYTGGYSSALATTLAASALTYRKVVRAYAAFPTPGTAWDTGTVGGSNYERHFVFYRVSTP